MLNVDERSHANQRSPLVHWVHRAIGLQRVRVQVRIRGNHLHILCEGSPCPEVRSVVAPLVRALIQTNLNTFLPADQPQIYQVLIYGRTAGQKRPDWTELIYLNQLDRYLEQLQVSGGATSLAGISEDQSTSTATLHRPQELPFPQPEPPTASQQPTFSSGVTPAFVPPQSKPGATTKPTHIRPITGSALIVSNRSLARQGHPEAIARYLSETLSTLGVGVKVKAKALPCLPPTSDGLPSQALEHRLCILCESIYSPDPALLAEPIAHQLRDLEISGFRDALILSQVSGEIKPDWILRIDLTPPAQMLKEWARWGDVQAIARLLNQSLAEHQTQVTAELKDATLHLVCQNESHHASQAPDKQMVVAAIATVLESIAPQGIHAATVYGQIAQQDAPTWIDWLDLPAAIHPALAEPTLALAQQGDQPAIAFLLSRLLNPDLDRRLATGGTRIQLLSKADLLHVMSDAPVCPQQKQIGPAVAKFLRQLRIPNITGVRVYGRRAGQKRPLWSYGADFVPRERMVPEATPEFAASEAYVSDLLGDTDEGVLRPDLTPGDLQAAIAQAQARVTELFQQHVLDNMTQVLIRSQLFVPSQQQLPGQAEAYKAFNRDAVTEPKPLQGAKVALIWGTLGILLTLQTDWVFGQVLGAKPNLNALDSVPATAAPQPAPKGKRSPQPKATARSRSPFTLKKSQTDDKSVFNSSGFTQAGNADSAFTQIEEPLDNSTAPKVLKAEPLKSSAATVAILAAARSPYPTFNSRQLDEKLALYQQRIAELGKPPDVLVIGSSRALRGIDPTALQKALAAQGYPGVTVFNFGVNGATAQVVDLIIRQILTPEQLPKLIVWADGARAFNSGRVDMTYNAIAASEGYKKLGSGTLPQTKAADLQPENATSSTGTNNAIPSATQESRSANTNGYQVLNNWLNQALANVSTVYPERDRLKGVLRDRIASLVTSPQPSSDSKINAQRQAATNSLQQSAPEEGSTDSLLYAVDFDGFLPLSIRFNPATYYQKYSKVSGDYDSDYDAFRLEGKQTTALESLLQFTRTRQIPLVFINLPLTQEYLDPVRSSHEQKFQQYLLLLATQQSFVFRDLGELWPTQTDYFSDPSHLNRYGAYQVSNRLARDPMIPWPRSQKQ